MSPRVKSKRAMHDTFREKWREVFFFLFLVGRLPFYLVDSGPPCDDLPADMKTLHYACLVEAGDVLYEAGETSFHREIAQAVATHSNQEEVRRSFLFENCAISYQLDMAIVFVVVSCSTVDLRLVFAALQEMKRRFRHPDRALHFEEALKEVLEDYNVDLTKDNDDSVQKIKREMMALPEISHEFLEAIVPSQTLDELRSSAPLAELQLTTPPTEHSHSHVPKSGSRVVTAVLACTFISITLVILLIVWGYESSRPSPATPPPADLSPYDVAIPSPTSR